MKTFIKKILFFCCFCLISCSAQKKEVQNSSIVSFKKITNQSHGGSKEELYLIISNQKELQKVYAQINMFRKPGLAIPSVNFKNEKIIALFMGQKNTGGYMIEIDTIISKKDASIEIKIKETIPNNDMVTMAITHPFSIYLLYSNAKISFKKIP